MKKLIIASIIICALTSCHQNNKTEIPTLREVRIDSCGTFRYADDNSEAVFFGTNYTAPFAYAYRAMKRQNCNIYNVVDNDVYHMARLGFNAYRIHLWDVELSDSAGNLLENEHLDLLDYLMMRLAERHIYTIITLQTNFGNGYPEPNEKTNGYSYRFDKHHVHSDSAAIECQHRYATALMQHRNKYTGRRWASDVNIVGFEVNNEPSHTDSPEGVLNYINGMVQTMRDAGCTRPIFYNISHNGKVRETYFKANIDGVTAQWYPTGLVTGHARQGNCLPSVDVYPDEIGRYEGAANKARIVYEFDPGDMLGSYLYPAIARSFRAAGFGWITQFAYDPTPLAPFNTEYQTHYLNLAYTPAKAISAAIAAQTSREIPLYYKSTDYPTDTTFGHTTVSYKQDLSLFNSDSIYMYSNNTDIQPIEVDKLVQIAGHGSSPIIKYSGTGAYFLDKIEDGVWRLEVIPDHELTTDPFVKSSENKIVNYIRNRFERIHIALPNLGHNFYIKCTDNNSDAYHCVGDSVDVMPYSYILYSSEKQFDNKWLAARIGNIQVDEYAYTPNTQMSIAFTHQAPTFAPKNADIHISCIADEMVDSVIAMPNYVSMWRTNNEQVVLKRTSPNQFEGALPQKWFWGNKAEYFLTTYSNGVAKTHPDNVDGSPIFWQSEAHNTYSIKLLATNDCIPLIQNAATDDHIEIFGIPAYRGLRENRQTNLTNKADYLELSIDTKPSNRYFVRKYVGDIMNEVRAINNGRNIVRVYANIKGINALNFSVVDKDGITFSTKIKPTNGYADVDLNTLKQTATAILPIGFPEFVPKYFSPNTLNNLNINNIDIIEISTDELSDTQAQIQLNGVLLLPNQ